MNSRQDQLKAFDRLLTIMDELREQCPWDKKQTMETLRHLAIEETYELRGTILFEFHLLVRLFSSSFKFTSIVPFWKIFFIR